MWPMWPYLRLWLLIFQVPGVTWPVNIKECSMVLESAKFKSTIKNPSIWAIDQPCMMKIVGSATVFLLLGALVPWSPGPKVVKYLSFQRSKWAGEKNLRKNPMFRTTFAFYSILKSQVWIGTWSQGHMVHRRHISASSGQNELGSWATFVFYSILKSQILIDLMTAYCSFDQSIFSPINFIHL